MSFADVGSSRRGETIKHIKDRLKL